MTPQALVQTARKLSPKGWKGQQTVIRRLSRTGRLPEKTMHDALRAAAKVYKAESPLYKTQILRPNDDTPSDLRADYLRNTHAFGIANRDDVLGWARLASNATVLKMDTYSGVAALVLFERERPEADTHLRLLAESRTRGEFGWLQDKLSAMPWSDKQLDTMSRLFDIRTSSMWMDKANLLDRLAVETERRGLGPINNDAFAACLGRYPVFDLMQPFQSLAMHTTALVQGWHQVSLQLLPVQQSCLASATNGAKYWHARGPTQKDCLALATLLDAQSQQLVHQGHGDMTVKWQERRPIVLPWISMLGATPEESQRAVDMYQQLDPDLLTFSTIAAAACGHQLDIIDNASELLCP